MKQKSKPELQAKRIFSESFKRARVREYEQGRYTVREIANLYDVSTTSVYDWLEKYSKHPRPGIKVIDMADSPDLKLKQLLDRIAELERSVGRKQMEIDYLSKMIELAEEQFQIPIKKNFDTPPSSGSNKTSKK